MNVGSVMPVMLLVLFGLALSIGAATVLFVIKQARQRQQHTPVPTQSFTDQKLPHLFFQRPSCWLAIKSRSLLAVQSALGLHNPKPCSFSEGLAGDQKLFIAPPVKGWILVVGEGLPEPAEDVDICFRFLLTLSRKLGEVQFFSASRVSQHHAWVRADRGRVLRAYAWAGRTVWKQGETTRDEKELGVNCFGYTEAIERTSFTDPDILASNVDKVPLLAARWSLDPAGIDERQIEQERGIAGEPSRRY